MVPIEELVDLAGLSQDGSFPSARRIRAALPRGWVLCEDGKTARRDLRLFFREGWILMLGLLLFGAAAVVLFAETFPKGWLGVRRLALLAGIMVLIGGIIAPWITKRLYR